jgi:hypothetical protein
LFDFTMHHVSSSYTTRTEKLHVAPFGMPG